MAATSQPKKPAVPNVQTEERQLLQAQQTRTHVIPQKIHHSKMKRAMAYMVTTVHLANKKSPQGFTRASRVCAVTQKGAIFYSDLVSGFASPALAPAGINFSGTKDISDLRS